MKKLSECEALRCDRFHTQSVNFVTFKSVYGQRGLEVLPAS